MFKHIPRFSKVFTKIFTKIFQDFHQDFPRFSPTIFLPSMERNSHFRPRLEGRQECRPSPRC
jgi:hypothetical protein